MQGSEAQAAGTEEFSPHGARPQAPAWNGGCTNPDTRTATKQGPGTNTAMGIGARVGTTAQKLSDSHVMKSRHEITGGP